MRPRSSVRTSSNWSAATPPPSASRVRPSPTAGIALAREGLAARDLHAALVDALRGGLPGAAHARLLETASRHPWTLAGWEARRLAGEIARR
jgi:hypothetical protein